MPRLTEASKLTEIITCMVRRGELWGLGGSSLSLPFPFPWGPWRQTTDRRWRVQRKQEGDGEEGGTALLPFITMGRTGRGTMHSSRWRRHVGPTCLPHDRTRSIGVPSLSRVAREVPPVEETAGPQVHWSHPLEAQSFIFKRDDEVHFWRI